MKGSHNDYYQLQDEEARKFLERAVLLSSATSIAPLLSTGLGGAYYDITQVVSARAPPHGGVSERSKVDLQARTILRADCRDCEVEINARWFTSSAALKASTTSSGASDV